MPTATPDSTAQREDVTGEVERQPVNVAAIEKGKHVVCDKPLAMTAAETGHLVLGTLHTTSATKTLDRIVDAMPTQQKAQARHFLAQHLRGVVSQKLIRSADGRRRKAIVEVLVNTPAIANLIMNGKVFQIPSALQTGKQAGMQLMDQALLEAVQRREIDPDDAYLHAADKKQFQRFVTDPELLPPVNLTVG